MRHLNFEVSRYYLIHYEVKKLYGKTRKTRTTKVP